MKSDLSTTGTHLFQNIHVRSKIFLIITQRDLLDSLHIFLIQTFLPDEQRMINQANIIEIYLSKSLNLTQTLQFTLIKAFTKMRSHPIFTFGQMERD